MTTLIAINKRNSIDGWQICIHKPRSKFPHDRLHVHLTKNKLKGTYSWNIDGSRHDAGKFPINKKAVAKAKRLAAQALNVSPTILKLITSSKGGVYLYVKDLNDKRLLHRTYVKVSEDVFIFHNDENLTIFLMDNKL